MNRIEEDFVGSNTDEEDDFVGTDSNEEEDFIDTDQEEEESKTSKSQELNGIDDSALISTLFKRQNYALIFCCKPALGTYPDRQIILDAANIMRQDFDRHTFSITLVDCFDDLKGIDAGFEVVKSNTL